jgi:hypothetical protein
LRSTPVGAQLGELQKVVKWLRKGGMVDALGSSATCGGHPTTDTLLLAATAHCQLEMVRELLKRGASIDLPNSFGGTALTSAAYYGNLSIVLVLLQHSTNPDLQNGLQNGTADLQNGTALMAAAHQGHEACVKALLRAKANTQLLDEDRRTALQHAEAKGHTAIAKLLRGPAPPQPAAAAPAAPPDAAEPAVSAPASLPVEVIQSAVRGELPIRWSSGCARAGWSTRTALLQLVAVGQGYTQCKIAPCIKPVQLWPPCTCT